MDEFDIPIFKKVYDLYRNIHAISLSVPKHDRYSLWKRCDDASLDIVEGILEASTLGKDEKIPVLKRVSVRLNTLRVLIRLSCDVKSIDTKKYTTLEENIDEIGRMLGGWIKSSGLSKNQTPR